MFKGKKDAKPSVGGGGGGGPPPPPPPPPPPTTGIKPPASCETAGRGALLAGIQKGAKLKHTKIEHDSSTPTTAPVPTAPTTGRGGPAMGNPMGIPMGGVNALKKTGGPGVRSSPAANNTGDDAPQQAPPMMMSSGNSMMDEIRAKQLKKASPGVSSSPVAPMKTTPAPPSFGRGVSRAPVTTAMKSASPPAQDDGKLQEEIERRERAEARVSELEEEVRRLKDELAAAKQGNGHTTAAAPVHKPATTTPVVHAPVQTHAPVATHAPVTTHAPVSHTAPVTKTPVAPQPKVPVAPKKPALPLCKAIYDYKSDTAGDLQFNQDDIITVKDSSQAWWTGELNGITGVFPGNYVELVQ